MVGTHEVMDGEVILAFKKARSSTDNLLELNHRIDWPE
jgi:hypothetical protein